MKKFRAFCASVVCLSLFTSMVQPLSANAQAFPKHLEKEFREDATLKVSRAVEIYTEAKVDFETKGAKAFAEKLSELAPKTFTDSEKNFIAKKVAKELILPTLIVRGDRLIGLDGKKEIFNLSTFEVAQGIFSLKEQKLIFNSNKRIIENYESWSATSKQSFFESFFLPKAHAFSKGQGVLIFGIIGAIIGGFLWPKISQWFKGKKETPIPPSSHSGAEDAATVTPPSTPSPATTPTTAPDNGTPAPSGNQPQPAADNKTEKPSEPEKPAAEPKPDDANGNSYLEDPATELGFINFFKGDAENYKNMDEFRAEQEKSAKSQDANIRTAYTNRKLVILNYLYSQLYAGMTSKELGKKILSVLTKDKDGKDIPAFSENPKTKLRIQEIEEVLK